MIFCGLFVSILKMQTPSESTMQNGLMCGCNSDTPNFFMKLIYILEWTLYGIFLRTNWDRYSIDHDLPAQAFKKSKPITEKRKTPKPNTK